MNTFQAGHAIARQISLAAKQAVDNQKTLASEREEALRRMRLVDAYVLAQEAEADIVLEHATNS